MANKPIGAGTLFEEMARSTFVRVTGRQYDNMQARARKKGYPGLPFGKGQFRETMLERLGGRYDGFVRCRYCTGFLTIEQIAVDHALPLMRGGGVDLDNLDLPCQPCNSRKGGMTPGEFLSLLGFLDTIPLAKQDVLNRLEIAVQLVTGARAQAGIIADLKGSGEWQKAQKRQRKPPARASRPPS